MRYLIIGLGIYGANLAIDLTNMGHEVIGADSNPSLVEGIKDLISTTYIIDATDESALAALPLKNVDLVIVAIGENFGASIRIVALLKKLGVEHIYARAIDKLHESILESFEIDRILTPEQRAAFDLVNEMGVDSRISSLRLDSDHYIMKFRAPKAFIGLSYSKLELLNDFNLHLLAVTRSTPCRNALGITRSRQKLLPEFENSEVQPDDMFICQGTAHSYNELFNRLNAMRDK